MSEVQKALYEVNGFLDKFFELVKRQESEVNRFLRRDLGLEPSVRATALRNPLFVGLNKLGDRTLKSDVLRIRFAVSRFHHLRHQIEDLKQRITEQLKTVCCSPLCSVYANLLITLYAAQRRSDEQGVRSAEKVYNARLTFERIAIREYHVPWNCNLTHTYEQISHALTIPLTIYNVSTDVTRLPHNSSGFAWFTLGLTTLFLALLIVTLMLSRIRSLLDLVGHKLVEWLAPNVGRQR